jgi:hypothetical protein
MVNYTSTPPGMQVMRIVAITSVDVANRAAVGVMRSGNVVNIDTSYYVGAVQVMPSVGDQWYITKQDGQWKLDHRIPFNDPNQAAITPTQGQHIVGSGQGPVELQGTQVNVKGPLGVAAYTTATLPSASSVPAGTHVYDITLGKPVWSNGSFWVDATGTPLPTFIFPAGIPSTEAFGTPTIGLSMLPSGIATGEAFGTPTVTPGPVNISPTGIATGEAFGTPTVLFVPTFDAAASANNSATGNAVVSYSHTIGANGNAILVWITYFAQNAAPTFTVKVGGVTTTLLKKFVFDTTDVPSMEVDVYQLMSPGTGAKTIAVTTTGDTGAGVSYISASSESYNNVASFGTPVTASGTSNSPSLAVPSATGQMASAAFGTYTTAVWSWSAPNQTVRDNQASTATVIPLLVQDAAGAASVTFSATKGAGAGDKWGAVGVPIV